MQTYSFADQAIEYLKGVGPKRAELLKKELNIHTFGDLLTYFPFRYIDKSKFHNINEINSDLVYVQIKGKITSIETIGQMRATRMVVTLKDETGTIDLVWFQGIKWLKDKLKRGEEYVVFGKPSFFNGGYNITHPDIETLSESTASITIGLASKVT